MSQNLNKRYDNEKEALYKASALDPRFKALPFLTEDEREDVYNGVTSEATRTKWALQVTLTAIQLKFILEHMKYKTYVFTVLKA